MRPVRGRRIHNGSPAPCPVRTPACHQETGADGYVVITTDPLNKDYFLAQAAVTRRFASLSMP